MTCHYPCRLNESFRERAGCSATGIGVFFFLRRGENCRICPERCHPSSHNKEQKMFVPKEVKMIKSSNDIKARYVDSQGRELSAGEIIAALENEFEELQKAVAGLIDFIRRSLNRLNEIALKSNPLSTVDYINCLILNEERSCEPGWENRVKQYTEVKKQAETMQKFAQGGKDPFQEILAKMDRERQKRIKERKQREKQEAKRRQQQQQQQANKSKQSKDSNCYIL
jgi:hypothetical protein